jgi:hypothetical protein
MSIFTKQHGVVSLKTTISIVTTVWHSDCIFLYIDLRCIDTCIEYFTSQINCTHQARWTDVKDYSTCFEPVCFKQQERNSSLWRTLTLTVTLTESLTACNTTSRIRFNIACLHQHPMLRSCSQPTRWRNILSRITTMLLPAVFPLVCIQQLRVFFYVCVCVCVCVNDQTAKTRIPGHYCLAGVLMN